MGQLYIRDLIAPNFGLIVQNLQNQIDQLKFDLNNLENRVTQNEIDILDLKNRVSILESQVAQLIIDVDNVELRVDNVEFDITELQNRATQLEFDVNQLQFDVNNLTNRVNVLEQYFDTKQDGSLIVDITKSLNFTGSVNVTQDISNPNQANIRINDQALDVYRNGTLFKADVGQIDFADDLNVAQINPSRVGVSYTRPKIISKDHNTDIVNDTLSINISGDLIATSNINELEVSYDRPEIISKNNASIITNDTLSFDFTGELIANGIGNQTTVTYTRPKLITQEDTVNKTSDTLTLNFTGDVTVTNNGNISNINIDNTPTLILQKNGSNIQTAVNTINFNSDDYNVTAPSSGVAAISPRVRTFSNPTRSLNTNFIVSATRDSICTYTFSFTNSTTLVGGTSGRVDLQTSPTAVTFTTQASVGNGMGGGLIVGIAVTATNILSATIYVPAGYTVRLQSSGSGASYLSSMEVLL